VKNAESMMVNGFFFAHSYQPLMSLYLGKDALTLKQEEYNKTIIRLKNDIFGELQWEVSKWPKENVVQSVSSSLPGSFGISRNSSR